MGKYSYRLNYTKAGIEGTIKQGFATREAYFRKMVGSLGGTTESVYWAYGSDDLFIVVDFPKAEAAAGLSLALAATGSFEVTTTVLLTASDMDAAVKAMPSYRGPGG